MVVGNDAPNQSALKVPEEEQTFAFVMGVGRDARLRVAERVLKAALISARHTAEVSVVYGASRGRILVMVPLLVIVLLEEREAYALHTSLWWKITVSTVSINC